jgi:hypothetical protein
MNILDFILPALVEVDFDSITTVKVKACRTFSGLMDIYSKNMTMTQSITDCVAVCMATHLAVKLDGDPLWIYLVGAPSSGKSTICELISADEFHTRPLSKFTGLVTGHTEGSHLVPLLHNKCVVVKDGTLLLESTPAQLANVYGELRDIYDGSLEAHYRNGVTASFSNISFGMIIGITEKIYGLNMSALGERFLHVRLETERVTELARNKAAIETIFNDTRKTFAEGDDEGDHRAFPHQRGYTAGFLSHLHNRVSNEDILHPTYTSGDITLIQALADVIACSRASVPRDNKDLVLYDARPESSTRAVKQLARLALCLCYVYGVTAITPDIRRVLRKVALDTSHSRQYYVIRAIALSKGGLTRGSVESLTGIPYENCRRIIVDLISLGVVIEEDEGVKGNGAKKPLFTPSWIQEAYRIGTHTQKIKDSSPQGNGSNGAAREEGSLRSLAKIRTHA